MPMEMNIFLSENQIDKFGRPVFILEKCQKNNRKILYGSGREWRSFCES